MPAFGRIRDWDPANEGFRVRGLLDMDRPSRSYTWPLRLPILNQGNLSGCVGWTAGEELASVPDAVQGITNDWCRDTYFRIQDIDEWPGSERPGDSPRTFGTSMLAMAKHLTRQGHWTGYRWATTLEEIIQGVGRAGPVSAGVDWTTGCMRTDPQGWITPGSGPVVGGHAVLLRGHSARLKAFRGRNHWTSGWGMAGEFWVGYRGVQTWLDGGGEFLLAERRKT